MEDLKKLHKKADIIAALKMEKGKDPCKNPKAAKTLSARMCENCAIRGHGDYKLCLPIDLTRKQRKTLVKRLERVNYPTPFKTVESAKHLVDKFLFTYQ